MIRIKGLTYKQKSIINDILDSKAKFHILNASRQSGKSYLISYLAFIFALFNNDNILVISPSYDQARIIFDNIITKKSFHQFFENVKHSTPKEILLKTGSRISFKSAERPDSLRGSSNKVVIIDEYAFTKADLMSTVVRPSTAAKKGAKIVVASTPKGTANSFYELATLGLDDTMTNYEYHKMHYTDNPYYDLKEVDDARMSLPDNIFKQEYEAEFIEDGGDVFKDFDRLSTIKFNIKPIKLGKYYAGIDWGKASDSTVLTILDSNKKQVFVDEFKGDWTKQANDLGLVLNQYKPLVYAESNGVGDPAIEHLKKYYSNVKEFIMSNSSKKEIVEGLRMSIMKGDVELQKNKSQFTQMSNYTYSMTKTGLITYHHRPGEHDDYVDCLAIANYAYDKHNKQFKNFNHQRSSNFYK